MSARLRYTLVAAAGFALGIGAATLGRQPAPGPLLIDVPPTDSHVYGGNGKGTPATLRPVAVRVGRESRRVGDPLPHPVGDGHPDEPTVAVVCLTVDGTPVRIEFEVMTDVPQ